MINRRDVMSDAEGSRQLVEEHAGNLLYKLESLLDDLLDAQDMLGVADRRVDELENEVEDLKLEVRQLKEDLRDVGDVHLADGYER